MPTFAGVGASEGQAGDIAVQLYPVLAIGLNEDGASVLRRFLAHVRGHTPRFEEGVRCSEVSLYPGMPLGDEGGDSADVPVCHWFADRDEFEAAGLPLDPDATLPVGMDRWLSTSAACKSFLQEQVNALLDVRTERALLSSGIHIQRLAGQVVVQVVVIARLSDERTWPMLDEHVWGTLPDIPRMLASLEYAGARSVMLHLGLLLDESSSDHTRAMRRRLSSLKSRLKTLKRFSAVRCYPVSNRLADGTIVGDDDAASLLAFCCFLHFTPHPGGSTVPLEAIVASSAAGSGPMPMVGLGAAARVVPVGEVKRRLAWRLGSDMLRHSFSPDQPADPIGTEERIRALPVIASLDEPRLLESMVAGLPIKPLWDAPEAPDHPRTLRDLEIELRELNQRIASAPVDRWVELVDNFDYLIQVSRFARWTEQIEANRAHEQNRLMGADEADPEHLRRAVDDVLCSHPQPLCAADVLLDALGRAVDGTDAGARPFRLRGLSGTDSTTTKRTALMSEVAKLPSGVSLALRTALLSALLCALVPVLLPVAPLGVAVVPALLSPLPSVWAALAIAARRRSVRRALNEYIGAVERKYVHLLLKHLQAELANFDAAVASLVENERGNLDGLRGVVLTDVLPRYRDEMGKFDAGTSPLIESVVNAGHIPGLYAEVVDSSEYDGLALRVLRAGLLSHWRAPDATAMRRTLWRFCAFRFGLRSGSDGEASPADEVERAGVESRLRDRLGLARFLINDEIPEAMNALCSLARVAGRRTATAQQQQFAVCPPDAAIRDAVATAANEHGIHDLLDWVPQALAVLRFEDGIVPELLA